MESLKNANVSIAMTTHNGARYLREQLDSLLNQTLKASEIVVCDDCSTDGTINILKEYEGRGQIRLYLNITKLGVIANFKKAVSLCADSNYIALADQDDVWVNDKLNILKQNLAEIEQPDSPALVYSDLRLVDQNLNEINASFMSVLNIDVQKEALSSLLFGNFITGCTTMFNSVMRKHFLQMPIDIYMHDAWMGILAFSIGRHKFIPTQLVNYRQHQTNITYETNKKSSAGDKFVKFFRDMFANDGFLKNSFYIAESFYKQYDKDLTLADKKILSKFISLKNKPFLYKKTKSILARSYRYKALAVFN